MREPCFMTSQVCVPALHLSPLSKPRANMLTLQDLGIKERIAIKERGKAFAMRFHHDSLREMDSYPIISIRQKNGELPIT